VAAWADDCIKRLADSGDFDICRRVGMGVVEMKDSEWVDLFIRFVVGGTILVIVYILAMALPWRSFAGIFAAFPGVMASTVGLTGWRQNSEAAAEVAKGSAIGMLGGLVCILVTLAMLRATDSWWVALLIGVIAWFGASFPMHYLFQKKSR